MLPILAAALVLMFAANADAGRKRVCTDQEAMQAMSEADRLNDWSAVYRSFKRYAHCDDGATSEGYSYSIAGLLAEHWERLGDLSRLATADKRFERFVLRHVDETMTKEQQELILENARTKCPPNARRLCRLIEARAR